MAHLRKPGSDDVSGFDSTRNLQILQVSKKTRFYLVAGGDLDVFTDDESCAEVIGGGTDDVKAHGDRSLTGWEKSQVIRTLTVVGKSTGSTMLHAQLNGSDWIVPLTIRVMNDTSCR